MLVCPLEEPAKKRIEEWKNPNYYYYYHVWGGAKIKLLQDSCRKGGKVKVVCPLEETVKEQIEEGEVLKHDGLKGGIIVIHF